MTGNQVNYLALVENGRNNATQNAETRRHNFINEKLTRRANQELGRHNLVLEANQQAETAAGIKRAGIAAEASKYGADASASASRYAADQSSAATRYAADRNAQASGYAADRNAQTQLTMKYIEKQIQAARDKVNKAINDDNINASKQRQLLKNASDQFIKSLDKEMKKYEVDKRTQVEYDKIKKDIAQTIIKGAFDNLEKLMDQLNSLIFKAKLAYNTR